MYQFQNEEIEKIIKNEPDETFIITGRRINGFFENAAVTCDNSANNLRFTMADTFDGVSLWDKEIKIIYRTPDGYTDFAIPHSLSREKGIMTFSWLLSENVARVAGDITFAIRISGEDFVWNSLPGCFKVSQGIIETGEAIPEYAAEWIETLDKKLEGMPDAIRENETRISNVDIKLFTHTSDTNNPHVVTKEQVGLGNVDNTADIDKPISALTQNALDEKMDKRDFEKHSGDADIHITNAERTNWNNKYSKTEADEKLSLKENVSNKVALIDGIEEDTAYPTAKAVKDYVEASIPEVDKNFSATSENTVQNKVISSIVANALKGTVTGNPISISDNSPIEHEIKVSVDVGGATIKRTGKNLIDVFGRTRGASSNYDATTKRIFEFDKYYIGLTANNYYDPGSVTMNLVDDVWNISSRLASYGLAFPIKVLPNTQYRASATRSGGYFSVAFYDENGAPISYVSAISNAFTTPKNCEVAVLIISPSTNNGFVQVSNIQVELGTVQTDYEPYVEPITSVADENGNVEGIISAYPTTILSADDGVTISAEYNKDINKAFAELKNAILSLGGNV